MVQATCLFQVDMDTWAERSSNTRYLADASHSNSVNINGAVHKL